MKPENRENRNTDSSPQDMNEDYAQDFSHEDEQVTWFFEASRLDTEFPLSGGETEEDLRSGSDDNDDDDDDFASREHLEDNFPLSGG